MTEVKTQAYLDINGLKQVWAGVKNLVTKHAPYPVATEDEGKVLIVNKNTPVWSPLPAADGTNLGLATGDNTTIKATGGKLSVVDNAHVHTIDNVAGLKAKHNTYDAHLGDALASAPKYHVPTTGTTGYVLKKTLNGFDWAAEYNYTLPAGGSALGGVKTGVNGKISDGIITTVLSSDYTSAKAYADNIKGGSTLDSLVGQLDYRTKNLVRKVELSPEPTATPTSVTLSVTTKNFADNNINIHNANIPFAQDELAGVITLNKVKELATTQAQQVATSAYRVKGTKATIAEVLALADAKQGDVWNVTAEFTLGGLKYPANTNVVCITNTTTATGNDAKWDALGGTVDLAPYAKTIEVNKKVDAVDSKVSSLSIKVGGIETNVTNLTGTVDGINTRVTNLETWKTEFNPISEQQITEILNK